MFWEKGKGRMQNLWNSAESERWNSNALEARVYSARLLGQEPDLGVAGVVSVKVTEKSFFEEPAELIYVQAAGTNLANIAPDQLIPLHRDHLVRLLKLPRISTRDLEQQLRLASNHSDSPTPAISALLHAAIPAKYVDQAGADAILSLTNTPRTAELWWDATSELLSSGIKTSSLGESTI
jgi:rhamnose utilization protein RhaD (predicted bifunctional aldolase and dehydrogenase)